jgi:hypothetical protein
MVKVILALLMSLSGWFGVSNDSERPLTDSITPNNSSEYCTGSTEWNRETADFFYGTWKVDKLLGFANSYNDASEYPTGQRVIGDELIINEDFFSSKGLQQYDVYQYGLENPQYNIQNVCYNQDAFYRLTKMDMPSLNINDQVKLIGVADSATGFGIPMSFMSINENRLILILEAAQFELKRVTE